MQNYGTAGFGPQQQLMVPKDYVAAHRPKTVVLAFFAGNDIFDAEAFDAFQRSGGTIKRPQPGWRIKDVVSRVDTWFVVSALRAGQKLLGTQQAAAGENVYFPDESHLNQAGEALIAGQLAEFIRTISASK